MPDWRSKWNTVFHVDLVETSQICLSFHLQTTLMTDFIGGIIIEILFQVPGGFIRWYWVEKELSFWEYLKKDSFYDYLISFIIYGSIALLVMM